VDRSARGGAREKTDGVFLVKKKIFSFSIDNVAAAF
jgi:hypothetical protein